MSSSDNGNGGDVAAHFKFWVRLNKEPTVIDFLNTPLRFICAVEKTCPLTFLRELKIKDLFRTNKKVNYTLAQRVKRAFDYQHKLHEKKYNDPAGREMDQLIPPTAKDGKDGGNNVDKGSRLYEKFRGCCLRLHHICSLYHREHGLDKLELLGDLWDFVRVQLWDFICAQKRKNGEEFDVKDISESEKEKMMSQNKLIEFLRQKPRKFYEFRDERKAAPTSLPTIPGPANPESTNEPTASMQVEEKGRDGMAPSPSTTDADPFLPGTVTDDTSGVPTTVPAFATHGGCGGGNNDDVEASFATAPFNSEPPPSNRSAAPALAKADDEGGDVLGDLDKGGTGLAVAASRRRASTTVQEEAPTKRSKTQSVADAPGRASLALPAATEGEVAPPATKSMAPEDAALPGRASRALANATKGGVIPPTTKCMVPKDLPLPGRASRALAGATKEAVVPSATAPPITKITAPKDANPSGQASRALAAATKGALVTPTTKATAQEDADPPGRGSRAVAGATKGSVAPPTTKITAQKDADPPGRASRAGASQVDFYQPVEAEVARVWDTASNEFENRKVISYPDNERELLVSGGTPHFAVSFHEFPRFTDGRLYLPPGQATALLKSGPSTVRFMVRSCEDEKLEVVYGDPDKATVEESVHADRASVRLLKEGSMCQIPPVNQYRLRNLSLTKPASLFYTINWQITGGVRNGDEVAGWTQDADAEDGPTLAVVWKELMGQDWVE